MQCVLGVWQYKSSAKTMTVLMDRVCRFRAFRQTMVTENNNKKKTMLKIENSEL